MTNPKRGFTLIELLVVISIVALLSSVVLSSLNASREKGRIGAARYFASQVEHTAGDQAVGIWDFDECDGSTARDRSGFGNDGLFTNMELLDWSANTFSGKGCAPSFDGSNEYISMGEASSVGFDTQSFTLSAWVKTTQIPTVGQYAAIAGKGYLGGVNGYGFFLRGDSGGEITFQARTGGTTAQVYGGFINDGLWHHIVGVRDHTTNTTYLYVDGKLKDTNSSVVLSSYMNNWRFAVGARVDSAGAATYFFNGQVDEVRVFAKTLTAMDISEIYASQVSYYRFADGVI